MDDPLLFTLAVLTLLGTPGPTNTLLATAGGTMGCRACLRLIPAEGAGYLIAILTLWFVVGPAVAASPTLGMGLRVAVGLYLLTVAWGLWRHPLQAAGSAPPSITARKVFLTTLLNPKAIVFALGIIPLHRPDAWRYVAAFLALAAVVAVSWIAVGHALGKAAMAASRGHLVPRIGAAMTCLFAGLLLSSPFVR